MNNEGERDLPIPTEKRESRITFPLESLEPGESVQFQTQNTTYTIERREDGFYVSGNPEHFPKPTKVDKMGSTPGQNIINENMLEIGMGLRCIISGRVITSSRVNSILKVSKNPDTTEAE